MSSNGRVIRDDEEYQRAEDAKFKLAAELDDPLSLSPEERKRKMAIYDRTVALMLKYDRGRRVQSFPGLREQYDRLGWEYQEFDKQIVEQAPPKSPPATPKQPPPPEPKQDPPKPKPSAAAWLDD